MQLPALACALQRAMTERASISSKHVGANVYAMTSRNNCIPTCHEYLAKVTRRSFSPKPEVERLARETIITYGLRVKVYLHVYISFAFVVLI